MRRSDEIMCGIIVDARDCVDEGMKWMSTGYIIGTKSAQGESIAQTIK